MLTVAEALECVRRHAQPKAPCALPLGELLGLRLGEDVTSPVDSPPFDKSVVDGFAIATSDRSEALRVIELVTAGGVPRFAVEPGTTVRVMTGAPTPKGADAVVKWEDCTSIDDKTIRNPRASAAPGSCILARGASFGAGQTVLARGKRIGPLDVALLAEIGRAKVDATPRPSVAVLATGDELVEADQPCGPGQIRNSNGPMLAAALAAAGVTSVELGIARDDPRELREKIARGLECDVLLVSGGVSAGVKDLVPGVLDELGVREVFHQVRMKPGKPLWFGVASTDRADRTPAARRATLVFGLPGNPVSTLVTFKLFVEPALAALAGASFASPETRRAELAAGFTHRGGRPTYHPCRTIDCGAGRESMPGVAAVEPLTWRGSADLAALTRADCLAAFPEGDYELPAGAPIDVLPL